MGKSEPARSDKAANKASQPAIQDVQGLIALYSSGQLQEAETQARKLIEKFPRTLVLYDVLAATLIGQGRPDEAVASCRQALKIKPDYVEAHNNLGAALVKLGQLDEAVASFEQALNLKPDSAEALNNLGSVLNGLGKYEETVASCRETLKTRSDFAPAHANLGMALQQLGRPDDAVASYRQAFEIDPETAQNEINARLLLPVIAESLEHLEQWRKRHRSGINSLKNSRIGLTNPGKKINSPSFYLAYHDNNNAETVKELCELFRNTIPELNFNAPHIESWNKEEAIGRRIRVGFISEFLCAHTIGKLYQGLIQNLDRRKFELLVVHLPNAKQDEISNHINDMADNSISLPDDLSAQHNMLAAEKLDVLFYPDIGMSPASYFLAFSRLAPVQAVSWGHPDTTGLDSIDYFLSAACVEPENAHSHYSERLVYLNRLPSFYQPLVQTATVSGRLELGLPEAGVLYACPQSLFKIHPDFDAVLAGIAEQDPQGHIILIEGEIASWTELLRARWTRTFPDLPERVRFLKRLPSDRFLNLLEQVDVLLDPVHFGSGNTLYEAMMVGTPIVTWPGNFMRGRIVAGAYEQMGISDPPVAETIDDYAELAVALAHDRARRSDLRAALKAAAGEELFCDHKAVREFENFLQAAVAARKDDLLLPEGWSPDVHE